MGNMALKYMQRCIELARKGLGKVQPNPMVGCVIVKDSKIIGEGYHFSYGGIHAEVNAIRSVEDRSIINGSDIYISLEPCVHYGNTPPCVDLLYCFNFNKIYVATEDVNDKVKGKGIMKLKNKGYDVSVGLLRDEAVELNRRFFTYHIKKRPYIILKWAESLDGYIDIERDYKDRGVNWVSNEYYRILVHKWRSEEQSIMVGGNTIIKDNPLLDVRYVDGKLPVVVLYDRDLSLPKDSKIFNGESKKLIFNPIKKGVDGLCEYIMVEKDIDEIDFILKELYSRNIQSIFVEGGTKLIMNFIKRNLWDEARIFYGNKCFYKGVKAPFIEEGMEVYWDSYKGDKLVILRNKKQL